MNRTAANSETVRFDVSLANARLVRRIVERAVRDSLIRENEKEKLSLAMDLEATHANGCRMDFARLLGADAFNFAHDVAGIRRHIDRRTGRLRDCFVPRFAKPTPRRRPQSA